MTDAIDANGSRSEADLPTQWDKDTICFPSEISVDVEFTLQQLLQSEDTNLDGQITIADKGPKQFTLRTADGNSFEINGVYRLSNLLQELTLAFRERRQQTTISSSRITENPVDRLLRMIRHTFWPTLFRRLDSEQIVNVLHDSKTSHTSQDRRIYIPHGLTEQYDYYREVALQYPGLQLQVTMLPEDLTTDTIFRTLMTEPGIMALAMRDGRGLQYVVPGGRFNEFYYWDSYFSALGLLECGMVDVVCDIIDNMRFQIEHYGCVMNANRAYYLNRSQPPFLTDLVVRTYRALVDLGRANARAVLEAGIVSAIQEYHQVWMREPRLDLHTGLSRYHPSGHGIPPEVEPGHFNWFLEPIADAVGMNVNTMVDEYNAGSFHNAELDNFFRHDRAMRESGHDTSRRMIAKAGDLACIDLNALLYKYEQDIAESIETCFDDSLSVSPQLARTLQIDQTQTSDEWRSRARLRKAAVDKYLWNEDTATFHDFDVAKQEQHADFSAAALYTLWSGLASEKQAVAMIETHLPRLERVGGIVSNVPPSGQDRNVGSHSCQWDSPFGWAPHQMLAWTGLQRYGYSSDAERLAYRWLYLLTRVAVDGNGRLTERYNVTKLGHAADADKTEYGNQGCDFVGVNTEGFGWTNASYQCGVAMLSEKMRENLRRGIQWDDLDRGDLSAPATAGGS